MRAVHCRFHSPRDTYPGHRVHHLDYLAWRHFDRVVSGATPQSLLEPKARQLIAGFYSIELKKSGQATPECFSAGCAWPLCVGLLWIFHGRHPFS